MLFEQMKTIKEQVKYLLEKYPHLRDDDYKLIATFYRFTVGTKKLENMSAFDFLKMFSEGKLPHSESIRRDRQILQAQHEHLRGEVYNRRHNDANKTKEKIKEL